MREFGLRAVVAVNRFPGDTDAEVELVRRLALEHGAHAAELNEAFERGGEGAAALAEAVVDAADHPNEFEYTYPIDAPIDAKIEAIATRVYGAGSVVFLQTAKDKIKQYTANGLDRLPICMAKTHLSLSHDPALANAPTGFEVTVRDVRAYTGAGWLVALCGTMQTMPGSALRPPPSTSTSTKTGAPLGSSSFLDASVKEFLDAVPARTPAPGGGAVAAVALSLAAGSDRHGGAVRPRRLGAPGRDRRPRRGAASPRRATGRRRREGVRRVHGRADRMRTSSGSSRSRSSWPSSPPRWPSLPAAVAAEGNPNVSGDAAAGADLAAAVASIAARLVAINARSGDARVHDARNHAVRAATASGRAAVSDVS